MHVKCYRKNVFVENVWPANLALFVYVSTHCVETVKWLDNNVLLLLCFYFFVQNTFFIGIYSNSFYNVNFFSILNVLQVLWPIIRVKRYRPSIFKSSSLCACFLKLRVSGTCIQFLGTSALNTTMYFVSSCSRMYHYSIYSRDICAGQRHSVLV